jgi:hypothetical protein
VSRLRATNPEATVAKNARHTGYLTHTSDSAGSIGATINVSNQSHLLRYLILDSPKRVFAANPLKKSRFSKCVIELRHTGESRYKP